ncbi:CSS-motif domain-containing protein [Pseudomonas putida]|uniref:CSS-motif domain-containing protein n=1 Tax=Pseudomonas putida TaxID=303 RepID=UPI0018AA92C4|nr:CSS-motif domain-containing protein [Pseudomonas putida]MBF8668306.1 CSS-motif domain-containing protein [Pseudomonas putida]MBF8710875.1 CSS-motif domain-containing protein [Pseudomonas putida]
MRLGNFSLPAALFLTACVALGMATSLWVAQRIWQEANNVRINSYALSILNHAETVAQSLTQALIMLNDTDSPTCSADDLNRLKQAVFEQPFVRDAGRIKDGKITCTALWGGIPNALRAKGQGTNN